MKTKKSRSTVPSFSVIASGTATVEEVATKMIGGLVRGEVDFVLLHFRFHGLVGYSAIKLEDCWKALWAWRKVKHSCKALSLHGTSLLLWQIDGGRSLGCGGIAKIDPQEFTKEEKRRHDFISKFLTGTA